VSGGPVPEGGPGGTYALDAVDGGRAGSCDAKGGPVGGEVRRGGPDALGGGGGGVGATRWPPYGPAVGPGTAVACCAPKGDVTGATLGVARRAGGAFVTMGTSFQVPTSFARGGGAADEEGVLFLGGPPNEGGGGPYPRGEGYVGAGGLYPAAGWLGA